MHPLIAPLFGPLAEERSVRRSAEGSAPPPPYPPHPDVIVYRDEMPGGGRGSDYPLDFRRELGCDPFIGINFEDPFAAARIDPGMPPRPLALPGAFDEAIGEAE